MMSGEGVETDRLTVFQLLGRATDQIWPGMSSLPNADKLTFDTSRYSYNNLRRLFPHLSDKVAHVAFNDENERLLTPLVGNCERQGMDLMNSLLTYDPALRISVRHCSMIKVGDKLSDLLTCVVCCQARDAIAHPYFREKPFPQESCMMPTFPSLHPGMKSEPQDTNRPHLRDDARIGQVFGTSSSAKRRRV
jgi:hypothetical protein